jgi:hypothetical protein
VSEIHLLQRCSHRILSCTLRLSYAYYHLSYPSVLKTADRHIRFYLFVVLSSTGDKKSLFKQQPFRKI